MSTTEVLLVNPPNINRVQLQNPIVEEYWKVLQDCGGLLGDQLTETNLGLLYIASILLENGFNVEYIDFHALDYIKLQKENTVLSIDEIKEQLVSVDCNVIGISAMTVNINWALKIAKIYKEYNDDVKVILGGLHPTFMHIDLIKRYNFIDYIVRGEGELTMVELCRYLLDSSNMKKIEDIKGITYRANGYIKVNPDRAPIEDLDTLPYPAYHLVPKDFPVTPRVLTSRGCNGHCAFCVVSKFYGNRIRYRDPIKVVDEIEYLNDRYGFKFFVIGDLTFMSNYNHSKTICDELIKRRLPISWWCQTRADIIDTQEKARLLRDAGCIEVGIGVESASNTLLRATHKGISIEDAIRACRLLKNEGIMVQTYWIIGLPGETIESAMETIKLIERFIEEDLTDVVHISVCVPYPGTDIYNNPEKYGIEIVSNDFGKFWMNCDLTGYGLPVLRTKQLDEYQIYALWELALATATKKLKEKKLGSNCSRNKSEEVKKICCL